MTSPSSLKSLKVFDFDYAYLDSGPPASSNYTTWVFVHGLGFNGSAFEKLLPHASVYNLRIVALYRRGYTPSSGFRDQELAGIGARKKIEDAEPFYRGQGIEIATFLVNFATEQRIPLADPRSSTGGIVLVGWSLGTVFVTSVLAYLDELAEESRRTLQKYLHTVLYHDPVAPFLGAPDTDRHNMGDIFSPLRDGKERFDAFFYQVTGHFVHKSVTSGNIDDLEFSSPADIPHSLCELSDEERAKYTSLEAFLHTGCDGKLIGCDSTVFVLLAKRALFDRVRAEKFPNVRVRFMTGGTSDGMMVWGAWTLRKYADSPPKELYGSDAEKARDMKFIVQTEGNHFVFWH